MQKLYSKTQSQWFQIYIEPRLFIKHDLFFWTHYTQNTVVTIYIESRKTKLFMKQET